MLHERLVAGTGPYHKMSPNKLFNRVVPGYVTTLPAWLGSRISSGVGGQLTPKIDSSVAHFTKLL